MSLVGPRPALPYEVAVYRRGAGARLRVRPGMTGLWQTSGRNRLSMLQMCDLDARYVRSCSLRLDLADPAAHAAGAAAARERGMNGRRRSHLGVAVVGCGYWGPNLVRNFQRHPACRVRVVVDVRAERAAAVARDHHVPIATESLQVALQDRSVDLVVIASPTRWHYSLALQALRAGKHVLVMKPMTDSVAQAEELLDVAQQQGVLLAVDHTFVYSGAVRSSASS